ncbi:hypothetical protein [Enterococcus casseliflavus]|uniref:hypothetical protein n=1 Tax=Enterococcus casseliflavus TaxID=37734 RepID=UPI00115C718F|nr:hypothetical protein [Enterococcus casseliflavus]
MNDNYLNTIIHFEDEVGKKIYEFDSLLKVRLIVTLETEFNIEFKSSSLNPHLFKNYESIIKAIKLAEEDND